MYLRADSRLEPTSNKRGSVLKRAASGLVEDGSDKKFVSHDDVSSRLGKSQFWEQMWSSKGGISKEFDSGSSCKVLAHFLKEVDIGKEIAAVGGSACVPGCGRGYDVELLQSSGFDHVLGLELAPTAAKAAKTYLKDQGVEVLASDAAVRPSPASEIRVGNFFDLKEKFDVVVDSAFLCGLHPQTRVAYAKRLKKITKTGGYVAIEVFPVNNSLTSSILQFARYYVGGPPYSLTVPQVKDLMAAQHFHLAFALDPVPPALAQRRLGSAFLLFKKEHATGPGARTISTESNASSTAAE